MVENCLLLVNIKLLKSTLEKSEKIVKMQNSSGKNKYLDFVAFSISFFSVLLFTWLLMLSMK